MAITFPSKQFVDVQADYEWTGDHKFTGKVTIPADQLKAQYESNADTNTFTDTEKNRVAEVGKTKIFALAGMVL